MTSGGFTLRGVDVALGGRPTLAGIDLHVDPGERLALVGPSGAGKTTLLRLLNGMVEPDNGSVTVDGVEVTDASPSEMRSLRSRVGFIHQDLRLVPNLRVSQNVLSGSLGRRSFFESVRMLLRPRGNDLDEVHRILERVGIAEKMFERTDRLSGGQAQRVAVARALLQRPSLLIADEPVASVDPARAAATLALLDRLAAEDGTTLCVSLHDPALVRDHLPRIVGLRDGRMAFDKPTDELSDADFEDLYRLEPDGEL